MVNIAINGFGRIGRLILRIGSKEKDFNFVAINDLTDAKTLAHLLKRDTVHGTFDAKVESGNDYISINGKKIKVISEKDLAKLPWKELGVDIVIESTGKFTKKEDLEQHLKSGAKKVLLSAPGKGGDVKTIVMGANHEQAKGLNILSNASCTTNSLIPVVQVLDKEFGTTSQLADELYPPTYYSDK